MSDKSGTHKLQSATKRDMTLINILERMVDQLHVQESLIKELVDRQARFSATIDDSMYRHDLGRDEVDGSIKSLQDSFARYRSDMLTFVHEQDVIRKNMEDALEDISKISYSLENTSQIVSDIEKGFSKHEKDVRDNIIYTNQRWESLPNEFFETNRNISQLRMDMEKSFGQVSTDTERQLEKHQRETTRRLLALDDMMSALETLLIRTEPPEKKPPLFSRIIRCIKRLFRKADKFLRKTFISVKKTCSNVFKSKQNRE